MEETKSCMITTVVIAMQLDNRHSTRVVAIKPKWIKLLAYLIVQYDKGEQDVYTSLLAGFIQQLLN